MTMYEKIVQTADSITEELVGIRRDFHKYAESGWFEMRTSSIIARKLTEMGVDEVLVGEQVCKRESRMGVPEEAALEKSYQRAVEQGGDPEFLPYTKGGMTGVIGIIKCGEGPTVAMRFDIDALGVIEDQDDGHRPAAEGFASVNYGMMHACGHDGHATMGLYTTLALNEIKDELCGTIKMIFQPAEEGVKGAQSVAESGILDDVDMFFSSHLGMGYKTGELIGLTKDFLSTTKIDATFHGVASHAGMTPQEGRSAILAASAACLAMHTACQDSRGASRINVGTIHGGTGRNVVPDKAVIQIETRGKTTDIERNVYNRAMESIEGAAKMFGCTVETAIMGSAASADSDWALEPYISRAKDRLPEITKYQAEDGFTGSE
ncbi:MAG: amidohydrolase, partial [Lachnospiraceae bacterium]|nr:amidohydrolase [Lachnospiraceae bacterium]